MTTWKKIYEVEHPVFAEDAAKSLDGFRFLGKHVRVTVEEEVSECCERWRGASVWRSIVTTEGTTSACSSDGPYYPRFCPECGRPL
jgi:hypothetical protein